MVQTWKTVRIFISSTFRDMHAERDHLVKVVFPELRERCAKRQMHLIDIDLRWGVTEEEAEAGKTLDICLDEIERSRPFFIGLLGERYGSILEKVSEDAEFAYPWLTDHKDNSLTALEIIHGVLRNPDLSKRSFFYFRDPAFISLVPENKRIDFATESDEASRKLNSLKDRIRASGRSVMENYPCRWDEARQIVSDLDVFGNRVLEDVWTAICAEYPEDEPAPDPLVIERQMHKAFVEERSRHHIGREKEAAKLTEYVQGNDRRPIVITGELGCGKSAFLANWCRKYTSENPDDFVLAYFIGASPDSMNHHRLLRNMSEELKRKYNLKEEIPQEDQKLPQMLTRLLIMAFSKIKSDKASFIDRLLGRSPKLIKDRRIIIMLDALDQLSPLEGAHGLSWMLDYIPEKARLVVSSLEGDCLEVLRRRKAEEVTLPPLSEDEQRYIVKALLSEWRRKLDEKQMATLMAHNDVKNPLYLRVALEEIRLFGSFEQLTSKIKGLAEDIPALFDQVLGRLEKDHGSEFVNEAFSLIGCSRYGLSEKEMLELLRRAGEEQFPRALWARFVRSSKTYLVQRGELYGFFHRLFADAVSLRYLNRDKKNGKLANYFEHAPPDRRLDEYPYQLQHAEQWQNLSAVLSNLDFFEYAWIHNREYEWMGYWRSLEGRFEPGTCYQAAIERREKMEGDKHDAAFVLTIIGLLLTDMALYSSALPFKERALEICETALGPYNSNTATSLNNLAGFYYAQGKYAEAESLYKRALAIREKTLGYDHPDVARSMNDLGLLQDEQGKYAEAEPLFRQALEIRQKALGPDHFDVAMSLSRLGFLYNEQGKYTEAESLCKQAVEICEKVIGLNHPDLAIFLDDMARVYNSHGKYVEAEPLYVRTLEIREKVLGHDHPSVATSLNELAGLYLSIAKYAEAEPLYWRALAIYEKALGKDQLYVAASLNGLAALYYYQGKFSDAEPLYKRSLEIHEKALGQDHPKVAASLGSLANLYYAQRKYAEAEPLMRRAFLIYKQSLSMQHPKTQTVLNNYKILLQTMGRNDKEI